MKAMLIIACLLTAVKASFWWSTETATSEGEYIASYRAGIEGGDLIFEAFPKFMEFPFSVAPQIPSFGSIVPKAWDWDGYFGVRFPVWIFIALPIGRMAFRFYWRRNVRAENEIK